MKSIQIILLFLLISISLNAQPIIPTEFYNVSPKWIHYSYSPDLPRFLQLYEQEGNPIIDDKNLYLLHNIKNNNYSGEGYLVENIDLETGNTTWNDAYYSIPNNTRRFASSLVKKEDKLEMYYFKEWHPNNPSYWSKSRMNKIDYCADTGEKCDSIITDVNDTLNTVLSSPDFIYAALNFSTYLFSNNTKTQYVNIAGSIDKTTNQKYVSFKVKNLNESGHTIDSVYHKINTPYSVRVVRLEQYQPQKYVLFYLSSNNTSGNGGNEVKLVYFDKDFNLEKTVDISKLVSNYSGCILQHVDQDYFSLIFVTQVGNVYKLTTVLLKSNGEFVGSTSFDDFKVANLGYFTSTYLKDKKQTVLAITNRENGKKYKMDILATDNKGTYNLMKTVYMKGLIGIFDLNPVGDSSLLFRFKYVDSLSKNEYKVDCQWSIWALFPLSSLGFTTSTNEVIADNNVSYYPNPTSNLLTINSKVEYDKIKVYSIEGRMILEAENFDNTLETAQLNAGVFIFELWKDNKLVSNKHKFVKIE